MTAAQTLSWIEALTAIAVFWQSLELRKTETSKFQRHLQGFRMRLCAGLMVFAVYDLGYRVSGQGFPLVSGALDLILFTLGLFLIRRFHGPYNGGSDKMTLLILGSCALARLINTPLAQDILLSYLSIQLVFSYFIAGVAKLREGRWRSGEFLMWVFKDSFYPVTEKTREWTRYPKALKALSFLALGFELLFPLALFSRLGLILAVAMAFIFHLGNAWFFGLNRFLWIWPAAYPALFWFQNRWL